jgi:ribonuclease P protein component
MQGGAGCGAMAGGEKHSLEKGVHQPVPEISQSFPASHRLTGESAFAAVYKSGRKSIRGPLVIFAMANDLPHSRWGLSVSRRIGTAVKRNRIKRLIRESIRLLRPELFKGYDVIIVIKPHETMKLEDYQRILRELCAG